MKRSLYVDQRENNLGGFWYTAVAGNGRNLLTSEMYPSRSNALRAARAFIAAIAPAPVTLTYWTGPTKPDGRGEVGYHVERIRQ